MSSFSLQLQPIAFNFLKNQARQLSRFKLANIACIVFCRYVVSPIECLFEAFDEIGKHRTRISNQTIVFVQLLHRPLPRVRFRLDLQHRRPPRQIRQLHRQVQVHRPTTRKVEKTRKKPSTQAGRPISDGWPMSAVIQAFRVRAGSRSGTTIPETADMQYDTSASRRRLGTATPPPPARRHHALTRIMARAMMH